MNTLSAVWCARGEKRIAVFPTEMAPTLVMASLACILDQDVSRLQAFEAIIVTICCPVRSIIQPPAGNPRSQADVSHSPSACSNRVSYLPPPPPSLSAIHAAGLGCVRGHLCRPLVRVLTSLLGARLQTRRRIFALELDSVDGATSACLYRHPASNSKIPDPMPGLGDCAWLATCESILS
jgi:hypothetical protein